MNYNNAILFTHNIDDIYRDKFALAVGKVFS